MSCLGRSRREGSRCEETPAKPLAARRWPRLRLPLCLPQSLPQSLPWRLTAAAWAVSALLGSGGCDFTNEGEPPPANRLYFPTGLALQRAEGGQGDPAYLLVVNSNFDRRYNAGSVQSIDLDRLAAVIRNQVAPGRNCPDAIGQDPCQLQLEDRFEYEELGGDGLRPVLRDEVLIGSLARGAALSSDHRYLYVPSAADNGLTYMAIGENGDLDCGGSGRRCARANVVGDDSVDSGRDVRVPSDPVGVAAGRFADFREFDFEAGDPSPREYAVVAYREGQVALFVHEDPEGGGRVSLADVRTTLLDNLTGLAYDSATGFVYATTQRNVLGQRKFLQRVGILGDAVDPLASALFQGDALSLFGVPPGPNTLSARFVERPPGEDGEARSTGFIVSQVPNAVLRVEMTPTVTEQVDVESIASVGVGAARLDHAVLQEPDGSETLELVVVSSFLERQSRVFLLEAETGRTVGIVPGISGAFEVAIDPARNLLYVADFSASVIRVVELTPLWSGGEPFVRAIVGTPRVVEELQ